MEQDSNRYLLPFDTIVSAVNGEEQAMNEVLQCYDHYITRLSMENGCMVEELRNRLRGKLLSAVLKFKIDGYQR
ncbi:MAG: helix-turn-helix domain-containing protein [Lachnospiraceae bacterium]|nr:helix-turn-helix domain-containing protein [Lachnospiraceae bacterium]